MTLLSPTQRVERHPHTASRVVAGEAVILAPASTTFHLLNGSGSELWSLLDRPRSVGELTDYLCAEFDIDPPAAANDVRVFVEQLATEGLVVVSEQPL